jgi:hypothetical protein
LSRRIVVHAVWIATSGKEEGDTSFGKFGTAAGKAGEPRLILAHNDAVFNASNKLTDRKSET